jgi:hypothetical protein
VRRGRRIILIAKAASGVIAKKEASRLVVQMNRKASLPMHPHALRRRQHVIERGHDECVQEIVVLLEHGELDRTKVLTDFSEREPTDLGEAEEPLGVSRP